MGIIGVAIDLLKKWEFDSKFVIFYFKWCFEISYQKCGYFDNRARIIIGLIFFRLTLISPFKNKLSEVCDPPTYGVKIHHDNFWIYKGSNNWFTWELPFFSSKLVGFRVRLENFSWSDDKSICGISFLDEEEIAYWESKYKDPFDGEVVNAKVSWYEREWRPKWLTWTGLFKTVKWSINVEFDKEIGRGKEDYYGGVVGCSYDMFEWEHPIDCLKRMERERKF